MFKFRFFSFFVLIFFVCTAFAGAAEGSNAGVAEGAKEGVILPEDPPCVWFIHGMIFGRNDFREELALLREIYPRASQVVLKRWNAPTDGIQTLHSRWVESLKNAETYAQTLSEEIMALPEPQRRRLVLAGHSLGGRIVIHAMARCFAEREDVRIRQIILAGTADSFDDPDLLFAIQTSQETVYSLINEHDVILAAYKISENHQALGTGCLFTYDPERFYEIALSGTLNHYGYEYFERLLECIRADDFRNENVIVPQDETQVDVPVPRQDPMWNTLDAHFGWVLQQNRLTRSCRILSAENVRAASGRYEVLHTSFMRVTQQLEVRSRFPAPQDGIEIRQTHPVVNFDALGSSGWWQTIEEFQGWKVQKSRTTPFYRLLDPASRKRAYGSRIEIKKAQNQVKNQL